MSKLKYLFQLHGPKESFKVSLISAFGVFIAICACGYLSQISGQPLLVVSFGASATIIFGLSRTPAAQPINVLGGYTICTLVSLFTISLLPHEIWSLALAIAVAAFLMLKLCLVHPPAAGVPLIIYFMEPKPGFEFIIFPVLAGALVLVIIGLIYNKIADYGRHPTK